MPPPVHVRIDPRGDLSLNVGPSKAHHQECRILVCSRAMCLASSVWDQKLATKPSHGPWVLNLQGPEWDGTHLIGLLQLVHGLMRNVQTKVSVDDLFRMMRIIKKYDMYETIKPVAETWFSGRQEMKQRYDKSHQDLIKNNVGEYLHIAWELGTARCFATAATKLLQYAVLTNKGRIGVPTLIMNNILESPFGFLSKYREGLQRERNGTYGLKMNSSP